jgi:transcriptional regulator with XRE-family HTH domain
MTSLPGTILREARRRAGLSQRALAVRAHSVQSVVARIEQGRVSPSWQTLGRLLGAAGFSLEARLAVPPLLDAHALDDVPRILRLTPEQRLAELRNLNRLVAEARRV